MLFVPNKTTKLQVINEKPCEAAWKPWKKLFNNKKQTKRKL